MFAGARRSAARTPAAKEAHQLLTRAFKAAAAASSSSDGGGGGARGGGGGWGGGGGGGYHVDYWAWMALCSRAELVHATGGATGGGGGGGSGSGGGGKATSSPLKGKGSKENSAPVTAAAAPAAAAAVVAGGPFADPRTGRLSVASATAVFLETTNAAGPCSQENHTLATARSEQVPVK